MTKRKTVPKGPAAGPATSGGVAGPFVRFKFSDGQTVDVTMAEVIAKRDRQIQAMIDSDNMLMHLAGVEARQKYADLDRAMAEMRAVEQATSDAQAAAAVAKVEADRAERRARAARDEAKRTRRAIAENAQAAAKAPRPRARDPIRQRISQLMATRKKAGQSFKEFLRGWEYDRAEGLQLSCINSTDYEVSDDNDLTGSGRIYKSGTLQKMYSEA